MDHFARNDLFCNPYGNRRSPNRDREKVRSSFTGHFTTINRLHGLFSAWLFYPGMFLGDRNKWWGDGGNRPVPHEGVDLCFYRTSTGQQFRLDPASRIPAVAGGKVMRITDDFLGKSIFVAHAVPETGSYRICTIYGHTRPIPGLAAGSTVVPGEIIASLSGSRQPGGPGPHLHLSLALISTRLPPESVSWAQLSDPHRSVFLDPMKFIIR